MYKKAWWKCRNVVLLLITTVFRRPRSTKLPLFTVQTTTPLTLKTLYQSGYIIMQMYVTVMSKLVDLAFLSDDAFLTPVAEVKANLCFQVPVWRWCKTSSYFSTRVHPHYKRSLRPNDNPLYHLILTSIKLINRGCFCLLSVQYNTVVKRCRVNKRNEVWTATTVSCDCVLCFPI